MSVELKGRSAIVTGGASGVGKATCLAFAKKGISVTVADINIEGAKVVVEEIINNGGQAIAIEGNIMDGIAVQNIVDTTKKEFGTVDILINCAGVCIQKRLLDSTEREYDLIMGSNVKGTYLLSKAAYAIMKEQNNGHIINIASQASGWPGANEVLYGTAKTAQVKLTMHIKFEFDLENKIRENESKEQGKFYIHAICPGAVNTPMSDDLGRPKDKRDSYLAPEDIANTLVNLLENPEKGHSDLKIEAEKLDYNLDEAGWFEQFQNVIRIWKD